MTSKKEHLPLRPLRHKSISSVASQKKNHHYGLRSHIPKVHNYTPSGASACNPKISFRNLKSVSDMRNWSTSSTSNSTSMAKYENTCSLQSSADGSVDAIDIADFAGFSDMEDDALQLAKYVESDASFDEILSETQKRNRPNWSASDVFDPRVENMSMSDTSLDELLDISIGELQKAANPNANTSSVTVWQCAPSQMKASQNIVVNDGISKRSSDNKDASESTNVCGNRKDETNPIDYSHKSNPSSRHQSMLSKESVTFGIQARPISTHRPPMLDGSDTHQTALKKRVGSAPVSTPSLRTPYTTWTKKFALKQKVLHLFNRPCYNYLNGRCSGSVCKWNHSLPPPRVIYQKLMFLNDETVKYMYFNFVLRSNKAFVTYFSSMCEVFGKRKMKMILLGAIAICEERDNVELLKSVFDGLVWHGSSKQDALTTVTDHCSKSRKCYDVLLEIMIESDALYFVDTLQYYKQYHLYGTIRTESLSKLLQQVVDAPGTALLSVFIDILDKYSMCLSFDETAFESIIPRATDLVKGNLSLTQQLNHIVQRMK